MSLQTYRYSGPVSGAAINHNGRVLDVRLHPNKTVQLPAEHEYTQTLVGLGYLVQIDAPEPAPLPSTANGTEKPRRNKKEES